MLTRLRNLGNNQYKLVIEEPGKVDKDKAVLAVMSHYTGTGCWTVEDVRLSKHGKADPYFTVGADRYQASCLVSQAEAHVVRNALREYTECGTEDGAVQFNWCTYDGLVVGRKSTEILGGPMCLLAHDYPLFHTRAEGLDLLASMAEFWGAWPHQVDEPDIVQRAGRLKIENPAWQDTETSLAGAVYLRNHQEANRRIEAIAELRDGAGTAYVLWRLATEALQSKGGDAGSVDWVQVQEAVIAQSMLSNKQSAASVRSVLAKHSPVAVSLQQEADLVRSIKAFENAPEPGRQPDLASSLAM